MATSGSAQIERISRSSFPAIVRRGIDTLQVNLGYRCNLACLHCHVDAGPKRIENMERETVDEVLAFIRRSGIRRLDLTGGAPEMNPHFRDLVRSARSQDVYVIDRCNLTILEEPGQEELARFLADHQVEIIASLPCYLEDNVDKQRGKGVFQASIQALKRLNQLGYGTDTQLRLNLVFNPQGAVLPPPQEELESAYKNHLWKHFGITFDRLFTLANMPIKRFAHALEREGHLEDYLHLLRQNHDPANLEAVMCRTTLSVDWQGFVYDCDFNQMLGLPLQAKKTHLRQVTLEHLAGTPIIVDEHCFGCTAGQGSSCSGALKS